ncbi:hypothetical protein HBH53_264500 [Parastagonospora nodorum]|nr:hypothetical protein HBH53_264500 [Parastagonospora nodorum]
MAFTATLTNVDLLRSIERIQGIKLEDGSSYTVVDNLEGVNLLRQGTVSILQFYVLPKDYTYLIDIHQLQHAAFSTTGKHSSKSLKAILEAEDIPKVFFDVRNDSDALYHHFQISLSGVHSIQLIELATRRSNQRYVNGLQRCIENDAIMTVAERVAWNVAKEAGKKLFAPEKGGRYEVFNNRPLAKEIIQYCVQDVQFLPNL